MHARNLALRVHGAEPSWVIDSVAERARRRGEELGVPWATEPQRAFEDPTTRGVVIATPTASHAALVERAAEHGKHVLCEKPIAFELDATWRAVDAARVACVHLQMGFQRRFDPDLKVVHAAIRAGRLGEIRSFRSTHRNARLPSAVDAHALGGLFADVAIHDFDLTRWLVGEVDRVTAAASDLDGAPTYSEGEAVHGVALLRCADGALGTVEVSRAAGYGFEASLELVGTNATIRVGHGSRAYDVEWLKPGGAIRPLVQSHAERHAAAYVHALEHFAETIARDEPPAVGGADGAAAFVVAAAAARSLRDGAPVDLQPTVHAMSG
jgi:myo-inositol 2-dehydrogenase/D-chiro-inositol 1-dehydrogenase